MVAHMKTTIDIADDVLTRAKRQARQEGKTLRELCLEAIAATTFTPERGRQRIQAMVEERPDWLISRQRAWGVPLTLFVNRETGEILKDEAVNKRIVDAVVKGFTDVTTKTVASGDPVAITGFAKFAKVQTNARMGRNPRSGESVQIPEKRVPHFKPGKALREAVDERTAQIEAKAPR